MTMMVFKTGYDQRFERIPRPGKRRHRDNRARQRAINLRSERRFATAAQLRAAEGWA